MNCEHILETFNDQGINISRSNVTAYCNGHCSSYILSLYERLKRDCGIPDELVCVNTT